MNNQNKQQMNNNPINKNHSDGLTESGEPSAKTETIGKVDATDLRLDGIFHPDSEVVFSTVVSRSLNQEPWVTWHKTIQEVADLFDSEKIL